MILTFRYATAAAGDQPATRTDDRLIVLKVPATTPDRSHHSTLSHGRSHDTRANEIWTAVGG